MPEAPHYAATHIDRVFRTTIDVVGIDKVGNERDIPAGSRVLVVNGYYADDTKASDRNGSDDNYRFTVILLTWYGRERSDKVSYDGAFHDMLEPEPGVIEWPEEFSLRAVGQGWDIFQRDDVFHDDVYELQAVDEADRFKDDNEAHEFVWHRATVDRDPVAMTALSFLYYRSPAEYRRIRKHNLGPLRLSSDDDETPIPINEYDPELGPGEREAAYAATGHGPEDMDDDAISECLDVHSGFTTAVLKKQLKDADSALNVLGGRTLELADEVEALRVVIAIREHRRRHARRNDVR